MKLRPAGSYRSGSLSVDALAHAATARDPLVFLAGTDARL